MANWRLFVRSFRYVMSMGSPGPDLSWITDLVGVSGTLQPRHIPALADMEVRSIIDLREEGKDDPELLAKHGIRMLHLPTTDKYSPSQSSLLAGAQWIHNEVQFKRKTVVHCKEGVGRSISVLCCALMLDGFSLEAAINLSRNKRWGVALNKHQISGLREFVTRLEKHGSSPNK